MIERIPNVAAVTVSAVMTVNGSNIEGRFLNGCCRFRMNLVTEKTVFLRI